MNALREPWDLMRILRLIMGSIIVYQSIGEQQPLLGLMGGFFVFQALLNTGCGAAGCRPNVTNRKATEPAKEIDYEEVA